jgi:hypothetical protein
MTCRIVQRMDFLGSTSTSMVNQSILCEVFCLDSALHKCTQGIHIEGAVSPQGSCRGSLQI